MGSGRQRKRAPGCNGGTESSIFLCGSVGSSSCPQTQRGRSESPTRPLSCSKLVAFQIPVGNFNLSENPFQVKLCADLTAHQLLWLMGQMEACTLLLGLTLERNHVVRAAGLCGAPGPPRLEV